MNGERHDELGSCRRWRLAAAVALRFVIGLAALSCTLSAAELPVIIELPQSPPAWSEADAWELSADGGAVWTPFLAGGRLVVGLSRSQSAFILARARFGTGRTEAYGALWPHDAAVEGGRPLLRLGVGAGWAAAVDRALAGSGGDLGDFNLPRLAREAEARLADPWRCEPCAIARAIAGGAFRADYLREPALRDELLAGLPPALYGRSLASASPWGQELMVDGAGRAAVRLGAVPARWLGQGYELSAGLSPEGEPVWAARSIGN